MQQCGHQVVTGIFKYHFTVLIILQQHPEFTISLMFVIMYILFWLLLLTSFKGMRDDLTCILDEDLSAHCLCALHCEMRNTEQILKSVGLLAYEISSLPECNAELARYGPDNFYGDRITVKVKSGQKTAVGRNNIKFASCSGQCSHQPFLYMAFTFCYC